MKKIILHLLLVAFSSFNLYSQSEYWQQKVDTRINVLLNDSTHFLHGNIAISYQNNSPDRLDFIYMHLYPNAYRNVNTAFARQQLEARSTNFFFSEKWQRGYIDSLDFKVVSNGNTESAKIENTQNIDIIKLMLPHALAPGETITIKTPFRVKIPYVFSRMGHNDQSYQISQWFPKPAVYDASGWHPMPYLDQGEFYSEYGDYEVSITLPDNYIVMGTGNIQEATENEWLDRLSQVKVDSMYISQHKDKPKSSPNQKTITFRESNIHDFAWFADKNWVVRKDTVMQPDGSGIVTAYSAFYPKHYDAWKNSVNSIKKTIRGYGSKVGIYPYETVKVVEGSLKAGGGMEYPTVTVIEASNNANTVDKVIVHEVGHNWFYGILGSNERDYPWMDEGINSFYEGKFTGAGNRLQIFDKMDENNMAYTALGASRKLYPATMKSTMYPTINYGVDIYMKVPLYLNYLEAYLGVEEFDRNMHEYFRTWQFKHPQPLDFESLFKKNSTKDIQWFFDMMNSGEMVDLAIVNTQKTGNLTQVTIRNNNSFALPVHVYAESGGLIAAQQWTEPFVGEKVLTFDNIAEPARFYIAPSIPNGNLKRNSSERKTRLKPLVNVNFNEYKTIWYSPAIGYNYYDGFMAGLLLHNVTLPENKVRFYIAPMYGFKSGNVVGSGVINYTTHLKNKTIDNLDFYLYFKKFGYNRTFYEDRSNPSLDYFKIAPEMVINFTKPNLRSPASSSLSLKGYYIGEQQFIFDTIPGTEPKKGAYGSKYYGKITYRFVNNKVINPSNYTVEAQAGAAFVKLSAEGNWKFNYTVPKKAFHLRAYAGKFIKLTDSYFDYYRYRLSNTYTGSNDYLYDYTFGGRHEQHGFWSHQVGIREGGFKFATPLANNAPGTNDDYLIALNMKTDIPIKGVPIRLYCDVSKYGGPVDKEYSGFLYEAGVEVHLLDYITVHIPIFMSKEYKEYKKFNLGNNFFKAISFSHNLNSINWVRPTDIIYNLF